MLRDWKEAIYNAIFNKYGTDSGIRKRYYIGKEEDTNNTEV
jgi:hypothetical protein